MYTSVKNVLKQQFSQNYINIYLLKTLSFALELL